MLAAQLRAGTSARKFQAALFLAALRGPSSIAHSVFVIYSAHRLSLAAPREERLLPLFWALNNYKRWFDWHIQNTERLAPFRGVLPPEDTAQAEFEAGMAGNDYVRAEAALLCLLRARGADAAFDLLWAHGAKDCVDVGHCAIAVANVRRVLPVIGVRHAEPILRWVLARVMGTGDRFHAANRLRAQSAVEQLAPGWEDSGENPALTAELLVLLRAEDAEAACDLAVSRLVSGNARAGAVWDAVHLHAAEMMLRKADDGHPLHANTAANALRYAFQRCHSPADRLFILLQGLAWQTQHRRRKMETDPLWRAGSGRIDTLQELPLPDRPDQAADTIFETLGSDAPLAIAQAYTLAQQQPRDRTFQRAARRLAVTRATVNAHDIKFPVAMFEDSHQASARYRPQLLAATLTWLPARDKPESEVIQHARAALNNNAT